MTLNFGELELWSATQAGRMADAMHDLVSAYEDLEDDLRSTGKWEESWSGSAGERGASTRLTTIADDITDQAAEVSRAKQVAANVENAVINLQSEITSARIYSSSNQFFISPDGQIIDELSGELSDDEKAYRDSIRRDLEQSVREIVQTGAAIERDAKEGFESIVNNLVSDNGAESVDAAAESQQTIKVPPAGSSPYEVKAWWNTLNWDALSTEERDKIIREHRKELGSLVGVPPDVRDRANRMNLEDQEGYWTDRRDRLQHDLDQASKDPASPSEVSDLRHDLQLANDKLDDLRAIRGALLGDDGTPASDKYLLQVESIGHPETQAIVSVGDISKATNVSMTVPGFTTTARDSIGPMTNEASTLRDRASKFGQEGRDEYASVAFIGYQAPQWSDPPGVLHGKMAEEGAPLVANELRGIEAVNGNSDLHLVANGHSYGSSTLGIAVQDLAHDGPTPVDDLVFYGSPGIPDQSPYQLGPVAIPDPDPDDLGVLNGHAFELAAPFDPITEKWGGGFVHGPSPADYGAIELSTGADSFVVPGTDGKPDEVIESDAAPIRGAHSHYPRDEYTSGYRLAEVLANRH